MRKAGRLTQRLECLAYTEDVGGSNPSPPTEINSVSGGFRGFSKGFSITVMQLISHDFVCFPTAAVPEFAPLFRTGCRSPICRIHRSLRRRELAAIHDQSKLSLPRKRRAWQNSCRTVDSKQSPSNIRVPCVFSRPAAAVPMTSISWLSADKPDSGSGSPLEQSTVRSPEVSPVIVSESFSDPDIE